MNFIEVYCGYNLLNPVLFLIRGEGLFVLNYWPGGRWNDDEIGVIVMIFMSEIVITVEIVGA